MIWILVVTIIVPTKRTGNRYHIINTQRMWNSTANCRVAIKVDIKCYINRHTHSRVKSNRDVAGQINSSSDKI